MTEPHEIVSDKEPIRLFKSNILEFFTHIHPLVVVLLWAPVMLYFLVKAILDLNSGSFWHIPAGFPRYSADFSWVTFSTIRCTIPLTTYLCHGVGTNISSSITWPIISKRRSYALVSVQAHN